MLEQIIHSYLNYETPGPTEMVRHDTKITNVRKGEVPLEITLMSTDGDNTVRLAHAFSKTIHSVKVQAGAGDFHRHDFLELVYVYSGTYETRTRQEVLTLREKEFCLMDRALEHQEVYTGNPYVVIFLAMSQEFFDGVFLNDLTGNKLVLDFIVETIRNRKSGESYLRLPGVSLTGKTEAYLAQVIGELYQQERGYSYMCKGGIMRLLDLLTPGAYSNMEATDKKKIRSLLFAEVQRYMQEHLDSVTPEVLADAFHFQRTYFTRLIKAHTGRSFTELLQELRLERAAALLRETEMPVTEIVVEVGYRNMGHFYQLFSDKYGVTPAVWRGRGNHTA